MNLALFDLDYTLLAGDSDHAWGSFLVERGIRDAHDFGRRNDAYWEQYKAGTLNITEYLRFALEAIAGKTPDELAALQAQFVAEKVGPMVSTEARALVEQHRGDLCAIVTATNEFVTRPIANIFEVNHLIACQVELRDGVYTGEPVGIPSFREGKIVRVEQWLAEMALSFASFEQSYFYSDSLNDLPLLERVTHPVAVNPDATLRAHAAAAGWPILDLVAH